MEKIKLKLSMLNEPNVLLAQGIVEDSPKGVNYWNTKRKLRFVIVTGMIKDWAVYIGEEKDKAEYIKHYGDKINDMNNLKNIIEADNKVWEKYRI